MRLALLLPVSWMVLLTSAPVSADSAGPGGSQLGFRFGFGMEISSGPSPGTSLAPMMFGSLDVRDFSISLELLVGRTIVPANSISSSFFEPAVIPCYHLGPAFGCAALQVDVLAYDIINFKRVIPRYAIPVTIGPRLGVEGALTDAPLMVGGFAQLNLLLNDVDVSRNNQVIWSSPRISFSIGLSLAIFSRPRRS